MAPGISTADTHANLRVSLITTDYIMHHNCETPHVTSKSVATSRRSRELENSGILETSRVGYAKFCHQSISFLTPHPEKIYIFVKGYFRWLGKGRNKPRTPTLQVFELLFISMCGLDYPKPVLLAGRDIRIAMKKGCRKICFGVNPTNKANYLRNRRSHKTLC